MMDISVYGIGKHKPQKVIVTKSKVRKQSIGLNDDILQVKPKLSPIVICASSECHVTPLDVGHRMIQYLGGVVGTLLEPSAGTGNLVSAALNQGFDIKSITAVERHYDLVQAFNSRFEQGELVARHQCFLDFSETAERYDYIIMNPPFKQVKLHVNAAKHLLNPNGVLVALVPITFNDGDFELLENLPNSTFSLAKVNTKLIRYTQF